jgi:hypothetical protein
MRAITACVHYDDFLRLSLPTWLEHFNEIIVVTADDDQATIDLVMKLQYDFYMPIHLHATDAFSRNGALFNRGAALEEAFDEFGRSGWICHLDADIVLPETFLWSKGSLQSRCIYGMKRLILGDVGLYNGEPWPEKVRLRHDLEIYGYFQLFRGDSPRLGKPPWYDTDWIHCAHCDVDFTKKWPTSRRRWLPGHVLHLGKIRQNIMGRITPRLDGKPLTTDVEKLKRMREVWYGANHQVQRRIGKLPEIRSPGE